MDITPTAGPMSMDGKRVIQSSSSSIIVITLIYSIVLSLINESRMTYGLRHQDYRRYR
jgi:hypothetical protein